MKNPYVKPKPKENNFVEPPKSKGIEEDYNVSKVEATREIVVSKSIMPATNDVVEIGSFTNRMNTIVAGEGSFENLCIGRAYSGDDAHTNLVYHTDSQASVNIYYLPPEETAILSSKQVPRVLQLSDNTGQLNWAVCPPTGTIAMWPTDTAPTGWLLCRGQAVSENTYADLFAVIGHTFGDPGSSNFNLPNLKLRFPYGSNADGEVSTTGGSTSYTPQGLIDSHTTGNVTIAGMIPNVLTGPMIHTFTGTAATIIPPYIKLNFIIKY